MPEDMPDIRALADYTMQQHVAMAARMGLNAAQAAHAAILMLGRVVSAAEDPGVVAGVVKRYFEEMEGGADAESL